MDTRATETVEPHPPDGDLEILPEGTLLSGRFELGRPLGWGGYAVVYEAVDRELHRRVAVKVLRGERVRPSTIARMRREVAVARDVTSPRLVKLYDITEDGPHTFITMELVEGRSLRDTLLAGPLTLDEALRIGDQILEALEILHASGIVHRDLKPANILLTPAGEVKIADFGLARHWANEEMHVTRTEGLVGTMEYLSPEQALGLDLDQRSDLYSFGVVLFEMLSGSLPFGASSSLGTVVAHVTAHAPDLRRSRADAPLWLSLLVRRLLEKDRDRRPASATAVRNALERKTVDWSYRWKRSRAPVIALAALLLIMLASGWGGWNHYWSRFDNISSDVNGTLRAYDRRGRALWSRPRASTNIRAALLTLEPGERRVAFMPVDDPSMPDAHETSRPLVLLDPQTGVETGRIELPPAPRVFPFQPRFDLVAIRPVDVDNDGADELVLTYAHYYWPSYSLLVNPRTRQAGFLLFASGHHQPIGAIDLDGDGARELLFLGPNNRMGWRTGIAALHASPPNLSSAYAVPTSTPDTVYLAASKALSWYTLLPRERTSLLRMENVDESARTFDLVADDGKRTTLTFDGFLSGSTPIESVESRQAARWESYSLLREAQMREVQHDFDGALALGKRAREAAVSAGETELEDWIASTIARTVARSSMPATEADAEIERILATTRGGSDLCWEVGTALSARAEPRRAANWFMRGLELFPSDWIGRPPPDYLTEAVVALVEIREWDEAIELVNRFLAGHPGNYPEALQVRSLVLWRTGRPLGDTAPYSAASQWLHNYWVLEHVWSTGSVDPAEFLERLRGELRGSEHAPWIRSIEAEVLARLGRPDEALPIVRQAWESVTADPTDATARIHRAVVEKRLEEIEAAVRQHRP